MVVVVFGDERNNDMTEAALLHRFRAVLIAMLLVSLSSLVDIVGLMVHIPEKTTDRGSDTFAEEARELEVEAATAPPVKSFPKVTCPGDENRTRLETPSFILAGAQKAGTSALYNIFKKHPTILASTRFESHFFDNRFVWGDDAEALSDKDICTARRKYRKDFDLEFLVDVMEKQESGDSLEADPPAVVTFEKTPKYICKHHVPALIKRVTPWVKVLLILRNPVDRAYSQWKMNLERDATHTPRFKKMVELEVAKLRSMNLTTAPSIDDYKSPDVDTSSLSNYTFAVPQALEARVLRGSIGSKIRQHKHKNALCQPLSRGMYAQQLLRWFEYFELGKNLKIVRYEQFLENRPVVLGEILDYLGVGPLDLEEEMLEHDYSPNKHKVKNSIDANMHAYLTEFYKPYNDELADVLGEEWRGVWDD